MMGTAARMPLTAPRRLIRNERSQTSVSRLWIRPFGERTPALLMSYVEAAEALDGQRHHRLDLGDLADVRDLRFDPPVRFGKAGQRRLE